MGHVGDGSVDDGLSRQDLLRRGGLAGAGLIGAAGLLGAVGPAFAAKTGAKPVRNIDRLYTAWQSRLNSGDLNGLLALYESGATLVNAEGKSVRGAALKAEFEGLLGLNPKIDIHERNHVAAGGIALTTNRYRMTLKPPGGKTEKITGGGIEVARRGDDGGWRFIVDDTSRVAQAPA